MWKKILAALCLIAILTAFGIANTYWVSRHTVIDGISEGDLVEKMVTFASHMDKGIKGNYYKFLVNWEYVSDTPNLLFYLGYQSWKVFGRTYHALIHLMTIIYLVLILGTYLVCRQFKGSRIASLIAAAFIAIYPMIYELCRSFTTYPLTTALFCFSILFLIKTKDFTNTWWSIAFGLLFGINLLAERGTPPLFMLGPLVYVIYRAYKIRKENRSMTSLVAFNLGIAGILSSIIALPYLVNYVILNLSHNTELITKDIFAPESPYYGRIFPFEYYLVELDKVQAGPLVGVLFFIMLAVVIWKRKELENTGVLFSWLAVPFIVFTIISQKAETYTITWLPAVAVVTGIGLTKLKPKGIGILLLLPVYALSIFHFINPFVDDQMVIKYYKQNMNPFVAWITGHENFVRPRPLRQGYHFDEVSTKMVHRYSDKGLVMMVQLNPDPTRDDNMDMAFWITIQNPKISQYYPTAEIFDHDNDLYIDSIVILVDILKSQGCLDEDWEETIRSWCIYPFMIHPPELQNSFVDWLKTLNMIKIETFDLGHDLPLNLYEVTCQ